MSEDLRNIGSLRMPWRERIRKHVRELRRNQTEAEARLWFLLRNRKLNGYKFLRQHPFIYTYYRRPMYFVADFYCAEKKLVVEVDGQVHEYQADYDEQRDFILNRLGLKVLRIKNEELHDIEKVKKKILEALS